MKLHFDPNQEYQKQAIKSVVHIFEGQPLDSDIEMTFAKDCETREDIEFYFKLPSWFTINTPIGTYNPDWALIFKDEKKIYFVAETKSTNDLTKLRNEEKLKIKCGKAHFDEFENVEYKGPVTSVTDLL